MNVEVNGVEVNDRSDLDGALQHWTLATLPSGFVAATMARVRAQPRFRLSFADAAVALVAAILGSTAIAMTASFGPAADGPAGSAALAIARVWLAVRPADPRLTATVVGAVGLTLAAVAMASWIGRTPRGWSAARR